MPAPDPAAMTRLPPGPAVTALLAASASVLPPAVAVPVPVDEPAATVLATLNSKAVAEVIVRPEMLYVLGLRPVTETVRPTVKVRLVPV